MSGSAYLTRTPSIELERESNAAFSDYSRDSSPTLLEVSFSLPPDTQHSTPSTPINADKSLKRPGDFLDELAARDKPNKNARLLPPPIPTMSSPITNGVSASMHAPTRESPPTPPNDISMDTNAQREIDPASERRITNSRITIRDLVYTAPPEGGFPTPQITKSVFHAQSAQFRSLSEVLPDHKIWIRPWGMRFTTKMQNPRQSILKTLMDFFEHDPNNTLSLTQPDPDKKHENKPDGSPWNFLLSGLTEKEYTMAINTGVIASKQSTLFISPFIQSIPNFVMMLTGITFDEGRINEARTATIEAIHRTLSTEPQIAKALTNRIVNPALAQVEFEAFLANITAIYTPVPNSDLNYWRINSNNMPNFLSIEDYNDFITSFINMKFFTGNFGTGEFPKRGTNINCGLCKSREHHSDNCPFPSTLGWMTPPDESFLWTDPEERKQARGGPNKRGKKGRASQYNGPYHRHS
ncbi:hypothetical protein AGABI2DRAFT_143929 [Agaricus bisporus var. bisporus H97]|uniref:hypothetical protein n=1 Tax=Agaricus bisporus var. bisporus (strain H97 / ATCC MYA-4626 / FGSC 10389) TaxID=936046 RepID=UPI00029F7AA3|nr:hypothetical protein AGABI2DRAFT_143929 [Agaricus bisporus var. bisporus H97]EKV45476.1 hypothetical protein AGABI2DRAFT_143929 [Agaricus bisporus var. bisporus H97]